MSWIKIQNGLVSNKKTARLAREMKWGRLQTVGFMISFWVWAIENCEDGQLKDITDTEMGFAVGVENLTGIMDALVASGFVDKEPLRIHDWVEHQHDFLWGKYKDKPEKRQTLLDLYGSNTGVTRELPSCNRERKKERKIDIIEREKEGSVQTEDSESNNGSKTVKSPLKRCHTDIYNVEFLQFWGLYPKKVGKDCAWKAWIAKNPPIEKCLTTLKWQTLCTDWTKEAGKYIPMPATWINQGRWQDEPVKVQSKSGAAPIPGKYDGIGEKV